MGIGVDSEGNSDGSVPGDPVLGFAGTHPATPDDIANLPQDAATQSQGIHVVPGTDEVVNGNGNPVHLMPWSNETFKLDLLYPFQNFYDSLQAPVELNTYVSGFQIPTFDEVGRALQTLAAGMVIAFDPSSPGDPFCGSTCLAYPWATRWRWWRPRQDVAGQPLSGELARAGQRGQPAQCVLRHGQRADTAPGRRQ